MCVENYCLSTLGHEDYVTDTVILSSSRMCCFYIEEYHPSLSFITHAPINAAHPKWPDYPPCYQIKIPFIKLLFLYLHERSKKGKINYVIVYDCKNNLFSNGYKYWCCWWWWWLPAHHPTKNKNNSTSRKNISNLVAYNNHMIIHTKHGHLAIMNYIYLNSLKIIILYIHLCSSLTFFWNGSFPFI